ncbi:IclR family transcriptional regulator [Cohnella sp. WQ 127256]|uniref:IclR family transcriptional regulator n=1 Tax=Cohnella sp. WQ 127256 TaxID=2938790 RepID=UPI002118B194|nr:IclR family transcriptional regulator [Cohnella sp. WQ 127256]
MVSKETSASEPLLSSVNNALRILGRFTVEEPEKRVTDLAQELGLGKSTVSRLLSTLAEDGYVQKDPESQKFRLGLRILTLNSVVVSNLEVNREARPFLKNLVKETSEAAHIALLEENDVVYVEQIECPHPVRILSYVGRRNPIHCTSSGKVLLAFQKEERIKDLLNSKLVKYTSNTITDPILLLNQLKEIKSKEFCMSVNEYLDGVISFSAPIRNYHGKVIAAVSLVGPLSRITGSAIATCSNKIIRAAKDISQSLGYMR